MNLVPGFTITALCLGISNPQRLDVPTPLFQTLQLSNQASQSSAELAHHLEL